MKKRAKKLGLPGMDKNKITLACRANLDELLNEVYLSLSPKPNDYLLRRSLLSRLNGIAKEAYGNSSDSPVVEAFGSFVMDMFSPGSDLDLSINFNKTALELPREKKIKTLRKFARKFNALQRKGRVAKIQVILSAKVPIVKVTDCETGIECDFSVENRDGIVKSQIVYVISTIDQRFQKLCILMKGWAKGHDINSSKDRTLNSLSIISLVAFHLQGRGLVSGLGTYSKALSGNKEKLFGLGKVVEKLVSSTRDPPILPPFAELLKDGTSPASIMKIVPKYLDYAKRNKESLGDLFFSLLVKLEEVEKLWSTGLCASTYLGRWITKMDSKVDFMNVEDFTDRSQNVARAVGLLGFRDIYQCIQNSLHHLVAFFDGKIQGSKLRELLFQMGTVSTPRGKTITHIGINATNGLDSSNPHQEEKRRLAEGREGKQQTEGRDRKHLSEDLEVKKRAGLLGKRKLEGSIDRQAVDNRGGKLQAGSWRGEQKMHNVIRNDVGARFTSPVLPLRPYEAPPTAFQFDNRVHYNAIKPPLPSTNPLVFGGSHGPLLRTVTDHFPPLVPHRNPPVTYHVEDGVSYDAHFPPIPHRTPPVTYHVEDGVFYGAKFPLIPHRGPPVPYHVEDGAFYGRGKLPPHGTTEPGRRIEGSHGSLRRIPFVSAKNHSVNKLSSLKPVDSMPYPAQNRYNQTSHSEYSGVGRPVHRHKHG